MWNLSFEAPNFFLSSYREFQHIKMAEAICRQSLAYHLALFPVDADLPKYGAAQALFYCTVIFYQGLKYA